MKQEDIQVPEPSKNSSAGNSTEANIAITDDTSSRRMLPVILATVFSVLWSAGFGYALYIYFPQNPEFVEIISLVAAYSTPVAIFWLIALAIQRTDPLLERRLAIANNLHKAVAPVEMAENKLINLNKSLQTELSNIEAVSELAAERINNLENRFQEQISNLFSATADTEAKTTSIRDILARERDSLGTLSTDLERRFLTLEKTVNTIAETLEQAGHSVNSNANTAKSKLDESLQDYSETAAELEARFQAGYKWPGKPVKRPDTSYEYASHSPERTGGIGRT
jgi:methyl-accepting chemotaxis protein